MKPWVQIRRLLGMAPIETRMVCRCVVRIGIETFRHHLPFFQAQPFDLGP
jgi:hypothetical protein